MLEQLAMPTRKEVEQALLRALLKHGGVIKEFGSGEEIVDEIAGEFGLSEHQRSAFLETIYRKHRQMISAEPGDWARTISTKIRPSFLAGNHGRS